MPHVDTEVKMEIQTIKTRWDEPIIYGLEDEICGDKGSYVSVNEEVHLKYKELVGSYLKYKKLEERLTYLKEKYKFAEGKEFDTFIENSRELIELKKMILNARDHAVVGDIYEMIIERRCDEQIYFKDVFDKESGAYIKGIFQTAKMGYGMGGIRIDSDEYETIIRNKQKKFTCTLNWRY